MPFQSIVFIAVFLFVIVAYSRVTLFAIALTYMFSGIWARAAYSWSRRRRWNPGIVTVNAADGALTADGSDALAERLRQERNR